MTRIVRTRTHSRRFDTRAPEEADAFLSWWEIERAAGSPTITGNQIRLQFEGSSTFSAWLECIAAAERFVYFENYVVRDDPVGREFRDALIAKAEQGVPVHVVYDWVGCWATPGRFWRPLEKAGVHVRAFNGPRRAATNPFGALQRDHRKLVVVDGEVAHMGGMCVGIEWAGTRTQPPWRDTGVEIRGPAAAAAALAFEGLWGRIAGPIAHAASVASTPDGGGTPVWIIEGEPGRARVYRTLQLAAGRAKRSIWITDAYFVAPRPVSEALAAAAEQGVDVRVLLPAHNNWPIVGSVSRGGYRFLLERGVRLFEWQGPMIHAKTSVVDGVWCRVGSSNLNSASLLGNWELDVGVLDAGLGDQLRGLFLADLASSVEIVLPGRTAIGDRPVSTAVGMNTSTLDPQGSLQERIERQLRAGQRGMSLASVVRAGEALGDALAGDRPLGREDRTVLGLTSIAILFLAAVAAIFPVVVGWTIAAIAGWMGGVTGLRALAQARRARLEERAALAEQRRIEREEAARTSVTRIEP